MWEGWVGAKMLSGAAKILENLHSKEDFWQFKFSLFTYGAKYMQNVAVKRFWENRVQSASYSL